MPFVQLPRLRLHYESAGTGPRHVILVHGNFASARWWRSSLARAPAQASLFAPSLRGCGESEAPEAGFGIVECAEDLLAFADAVEAERFVLVGHSLGGAVATQLAAAIPERIAALLLVAPAPTGGVSALAHDAGPLARLMRAFDPDNPRELAAIGSVVQWSEATGLHRRFLRHGLEDLLGRAHLPHEEMEAFLDEAARVPGRALLGFLSALHHWDIRPQLVAVRAPVTVLRGDEDVLIPAEAAEATARDFPDGRLITWRGVGHSPMLERPDEFAQLLAELMGQS